MSVFSWNRHEGIDNLLCWLFGDINTLQNGAQTIPGDSIDISFQLVETTGDTVSLIPAVYNSSTTSGFLYFQLRISGSADQVHNITRQEKGYFMLASMDTVTTTVLTFPDKPNDDVTVYFYVLENEFVIAGGAWTFGEIRKKPTRPRVTQLKLAKDDFEIDGLVFNETRTRFGKEFFSRFSEYWQAPQGRSGYWINIKELLSPGRFTVISVSSEQ